MSRALDVRTQNMRSTLSALTEENLRSNSRRPTEQQSIHHGQQSPTKQTNQLEQAQEEDDDDEEDEQKVERRRKASLQALEIYGGCFASGFLAMQQPLPWATTPTSESRSSRTNSNASSNDFDHRRSVSEAQSIFEVQEIQSGRRRSLRDFGKRGLRLMQSSRSLKRD
ncbi:hypothetical protein IAQ61_003158 [Plenodomus lingam]|nr:hypothetical protein IAQ61_003158 [Plenodomus lingam]